MSRSSKRVHIVYFLYFAVVALVFVAVIGKVLKIQSEADKWLDGVEDYAKQVTAEATRGNIFAYDGRLLASSLPYYNLFMDMRADKYLLDNFENEVDSLSICLSEKLKKHTAAEYKKMLEKAFAQGARYYPIARKVSYTDVQEIKKFPVFRMGRKGGLICEEMKKRSNPFGYMAALGKISHDKDRGTRGIEMRYDSLLKGKDGVALKQRLAGYASVYNIVEPIDGFDLITTIDVEIQDIAEKALRDKMTAFDAKHGCVVLMEVATGEVKACVNLQKDSQGDYFEGRNWAVLRIEPGSTFKTMSLIVALEDGAVSLTDTIDTYDGICRFYDRDMKDSNWRQGGNKKITVKDVMAYSSNIGISRIIEKRYGKNPSEYVNKLYKMGISKDLRLEIPGYELPYVRHPKDPQSHWYGTTLPWMSIGYELQISPINMLAFYNAIANNGVFIRPFFVKNVAKNGEITATYSTEVLNDKFCSKSVLNDVKEALNAVVEYGTGKAAQSKYVKIAGKTGTAQVGYGTGNPITHQVSFCGYFPADKPLYSCIVVIYDPHKGAASGGKMSGSVFKDIAEQVYARKVQLLPEDVVGSKSAAFEFPEVKKGNDVVTKSLLEDFAVTSKSENWTDSIGRRLKNDDFVKLPITQCKVPDVVGMGAKDAVYLMEKNGVRACISGTGRVVSQSIKAGTIPQKGDIVYLSLK